MVIPRGGVAQRHDDRQGSSGPGGSSRCRRGPPLIVGVYVELVGDLLETVASVGSSSPMSRPCSLFFLCRLRRMFAAHPPSGLMASIVVGRRQLSRIAMAAPRAGRPRVRQSAALAASPRVARRSDPGWVEAALPGLPQLRVGFVVDALAGFGALLGGGQLVGCGQHEGSAALPAVRRRPGRRPPVRSADLDRLGLDVPPPLDFALGAERPADRRRREPLLGVLGREAGQYSAR